MSKMHPHKAVRDALRYAEEKGWVVEVATGHLFALLNAELPNMDIFTR
ncbi:hypothetical protein [Klebsiella variicola]